MEFFGIGRIYTFVFLFLYFIKEAENYEVQRVVI